MVKQRVNLLKYSLWINKKQMKDRNDQLAQTRTAENKEVKMLGYAQN